MKDIHETQKGYIEGGYQFFFLEDQKEMHFEYHYHSFHKCLIVLEGKIKYEVEGIHYDLSAGDVIWVPSYDAHKVEVSDEIPYRRVVVYLSKTFVSLLSHKLDKAITRVGDTMSHSVKLSIEHKEELKKLFRYEKQDVTKNHKEKVKDELPIIQKSEIAIKNQHTYRAFDDSLYIMTDFITWMNVYFDIVNSQEETIVFGNKTKKAKQQWIATTMTYIQDNLKDELRVDDIAKQVYLSKYYFMRKFKETLGISIHQYIIKQRLIHARYLMKQGMNLTEISYQSGFKDYSTFARAFKKTYHKSPREFQKLNPTTDFE